MHNLAMSYQTEKKTIVRDDFASVVIEALHNLHLQHHRIPDDDPMPSPTSPEKTMAASPASLASLHHLCSEGCKFEVNAKQVGQVIFSRSDNGDNEPEDTETEERNSKSMSTKVGYALRQFRLKYIGQQKRGGPRQWQVTRDTLTKCIVSHGLLHIFSLRGDEGDAGDGGDDTGRVIDGTTKISSASLVDPQDRGDESDVGDEVMRVNKNGDLGNICVCGEPFPEHRKKCFACGELLPQTSSTPAKTGS